VSFRPAQFTQSVGLVKRIGSCVHYADEMLAHLHQSDIDGLATCRVTAADQASHRHLDECELCLRRLIDEVLRLASLEEDAAAGVA
jgi:hypothetical protein